MVDKGSGNQNFKTLLDFFLGRIDSYVAMDTLGIDSYVDLFLLMTVAYADALEVLLKPGWQVQIVDMVLHEVTRNQTPTSQAIGAWATDRGVPV